METAWPPAVVVVPWLPSCSSGVVVVVPELESGLEESGL